MLDSLFERLQDVLPDLSQCRAVQLSGELDVWTSKQIICINLAILAAGQLTCRKGIRAAGGCTHAADVLSLAGAGATGAAGMLSVVPALADRNLCTTANVTVQAVTSGTARRMQPQRVRKIMPTAPGAQDDKHDVPLAIQMAAAGYTDKQQLQLQLQRAFLEMYSRPDHKVHLSSRGFHIRHGLPPKQCCPACSLRCGTWWTMWSP